MCCYERCLCVYQTINDEVDGAVEDYEAPVKLLKIVSQEHSIPRDSLSDKSQKKVQRYTTKKDVQDYEETVQHICRHNTL